MNTPNKTIERMKKLLIIIAILLSLKLGYWAGFSNGHNQWNARDYASGYSSGYIWGQAYCADHHCYWGKLKDGWSLEINF